MKMMNGYIKKYIFAIGFVSIIFAIYVLFSGNFQNRKPFISSEVQYVSMSPSGVGVIPASCELGFPHFPGDCAVSVSLTANPNPILRGQSATLSWTSSNATWCFASCISGDCADWSGTKSTSGTQQVRPVVTSTYRLTCTGAGGSSYADLTLVVKTIKWKEIIPRLLPFLRGLL
jgi:hypothetical protein